MIIMFSYECFLGYRAGGGVPGPGDVSCVSQGESFSEEMKISPASCYSLKYVNIFDMLIFPSHLSCHVLAYESPYALLNI